MTTRPRHILLVDDEASILKMVGKRLQVAGFRVSVSMDGEDALVKVEQEPPDVIILDLMLPKKDGFEVCTTLKRDERYRQIPIILFTAKDQDEDYWKGRACGADAYLTKPFKAADLEQVVNRMVQALDAKEDGSDAAV